MEFADLDDDLFSEERQRNNTDEEYSARFCHRCWFLEASPDLLVSDEDKLSVQKHTADYLYFKKDYEAAVLKYKDILSIVPSGNTTLRRECQEGLARSCIKIGNPIEAFDSAEKLHATSKTVEQTTISCSVLIDASIAAGKYPEALNAAQVLVSLHPFNSDAWLRLAWSYACLYGIELPSTKNLLSAAYSNTFLTENITECKEHEMMAMQDAKSKCEPSPYSLESVKKRLMAIESEPCEGGASDRNSFFRDALHNPMMFTEKEKGLQFVCACLFRSVSMLKRTEGTTFGFALESSLAYQKRIWSDMETLLDEKSLYFVKSEVSISNDINSSNSPLKECISEFVDRSSSKFQSDDAEADVNVISRKSFERQWFKWLK